MNKILYTFYIIILAGFFALPITTHAANLLPDPTGYVNDYVGVLNSSQKQEIETNLSNYEKSTTNEISVVVIKSLNGDTVDNYAVTLFEQWKIGKKGKDNGVLLLIATDDHKLRIEVGYGLEGNLTDGQAGTIIRDTITPEFKKGDYYTGIKNGVDQIEKQISGEITLPATTDSPNTNNLSNGDSFAIIGTFIVMVILAGFTRKWWQGGTIGGIGGALIGVFLHSFFVGIFFGLIFGLVGLVMSAGFAMGGKRGKQIGRGGPWFWGGGGGGWGGGSSGGGGGFGGFGGGSSGGGGASGGW